MADKPKCRCGEHLDGFMRDMQSTFASHFAGAETHELKNEAILEQLGRCSVIVASVIQVATVPGKPARDKMILDINTWFSKWVGQVLEKLERNAAEAEAAQHEGPRQ